MLCVFFQILEKVNDSGLRGKRKSEVAKKFVGVVQCDSGVVCHKSDEWFKGVGGITPNNTSEPFLVCCFGEREENGIGHTFSRSIKFADDTVIRSDTKDMIQDSLGRWRHAL